MKMNENVMKIHQQLFQKILPIYGKIGQNVKFEIHITFMLHWGSAVTADKLPGKRIKATNVGVGNYLIYYYCLFTKIKINKLH